MQVTDVMEQEVTRGDVWKGGNVQKGGDVQKGVGNVVKEG